MGGFIVKRLAVSVPVLLGVTFLIFMLLHVVPGDPVALMMGERMSPEVIDRVRAQMHLDDPWPVRYVRFISDALRGDLGESYKLRRPVVGLLRDAFPTTLKLALAAALVAWCIGIPAGILSAVRPYSLVDNFFMGLALTGVSTPVFWTALLFQYLFSLKLGWLPVAGFYSAKHLIMPALVLGWSSSGLVARLTRSSLLDVMRHDYIRTARAKGLRQGPVILRHALKNALLPVVTVMALQIAFLLSGSVITESVFNIPGVGRIAVGAIQNRDMPLLQGAVLFTTVLVILGNLAADLLYGWLDPRIRRDGGVGR
ncbi:MAG TPA: ABC transporter permease [Synergistaceae bacterium]|nr:ABC transporter permease [Synergistaceae bacterium]HQF91450.1 ABC transporter permease [Synergistaceae bacterium]HQH78476.1 ABC transporter permease [Synergistaceae bacterium]HQK24846.1 ABC transporter permease [Synergistaceae bacterium]